ncbi:MAG: adenylate/guanylate cyclase domain-containing protein [Sandaracinaceae bacterium]
MAGPRGTPSLSSPGAETAPATPVGELPSPAPAPPASRVPFPLRWKLGLLIALLATVPLIGVGVALIGVNRTAVENLSRGTQLLALDDLARTVDQEMVQAEDGLTTAASVFANPDLDDGARIEALRALVQGREGLDHVALYAADGVLLAVIEEEDRAGTEMPEPLPERMRAQVEEVAMATGEARLVRGQVRVPLAVRIRVDGRTTGYVMSVVSLEGVQQRVERLAEGHFAGLPDALMLLDDRYRVLAHPDREQAAALASVAGHGILAGLEPGAAGPNVSQAGEYVDEDGTAMLGSLVGLQGRPWLLVAQVPQAVAYASLERMRWIVIGTVAAMVVLALIVGLLFARRISAPLEALTAQARRLAARRFDDPVRIRTKDELAVLGRAMNRAATDLAASEARIRDEVAIRTDLGRYIPSELVEQIVRREATLELGGRRTPITVLFADVVGFTPLTEQLAPEHVVQILNELFTILTQIVFRHGGTVDKFVGDCVMALWGAPTPHADHAGRALRAAEDMMTWLETGNARWQERHGGTIQLAIGIQTGEAVVGNIGSEKRMEYTAIGDVVNVAARLEAIARPQQILVTEAVKEAAGDGFAYVDADLHRLSGRAEPIHLYEVQP